MPREDEVLKTFLKRLPELLPALQISRGRRAFSSRGTARYDLSLDVRIGGKTKRLICEVKAVGEPRYLYQAIAALKGIRKEEKVYPIVVAPYISPEGQRICREAGVGFVDLSGNVFLRFDSVFIERATKDLPRGEKVRRRRLFAPKSSRILRVLLENSGVEWSLTRLAEEAQVGIKTAHSVVNGLDEKGYVRKQRAATALLKPAELLDLWAENYNVQVNPQRTYYTFVRSLREFLMKLHRIAGNGYALTLHSGASLVAPFVRHTDVHFYWQGSPEKLASKLDLRPVETGGTVHVLTPHDDGLFYNVQEIKGLRVVCNIQLYLDLIHYPARGKEQAEFLRRKKISF
jgi:hypothetical protein